MFFRSLILLGLATVFSSCHGLVGLRREVVNLENHGGLVVRVMPPPVGPAPTYALAWVTEGGWPVSSAGVQEVGRDGLAVFHLVLDRTFQVGAFTDENGNHAYDGGEPMAVLRGLAATPLADPDAKPAVRELALSRQSGFAPGLTIRIPPEDRALGGRTQFAIGEVADINEARFDPKVGSSGMWRPLGFLARQEAGIYFTEPYDPARIPVLLIHGIGGGPRDWSTMVGRLDRRRYQVWFASYPSGLRLGRVAGNLAAAMELLRQRHGFADCHVIAHSMGGLVAKKMVEEASGRAGKPVFPMVVTLSTPWGGHAMAEKGIRNLNRPVPSWIDIAPGSAFLQELAINPWPTGTAHHLIYGRTQNSSLLIREPNDGIVSVASQIWPPIRRQATTVRGYPLGHMEILESQEVVERIHQMGGAP